MNKTSIIKASTFSNEWKNPSGGSTYYYDIVLENGDKGSTGVAQKDSPKIQVGTEITYTLNGLKLKILNVESSSSSSASNGFKPKSKPSAQDQFLGYSWSYAKDLLIAGKTSNDMEELKAMADFIYNNIGKMLNNEQ
jgi:hypothetical protein